MKISPIILLLLSVLQFNCYSQETSDANRVWTIASIGMGNYFENKTYSTLNDTIINSKNYKAIYQSNDSLFNIYDSEYFCSYRTDNQKWYFVPKGQNDEYLLYDFNLEVNDTVLINNPWAIGETELIAVEIDSIKLNEVYHKRIAIMYKHLPSSNPYILEHWIEGFGCTNGLFYSGFTFMDIGYQLLCYHENNVLIYLNSPNNFCGYITTGLSQNAVNKKINIYPNPACDVLYIENNIEINRVDIFDISGKKIDGFEIRTVENPIKMDINNYPKYFLVKIIGTDFITVRKIIKE